MDRSGKKYQIVCGSKYFEMKYGDSPFIQVEEEIDFHQKFTPASFLYLGRVLAEGKPELLRGKTYYGKVGGIGEFVHEIELGEFVHEIELGEEVDEGHD
jgi:hypothetical protein